MSIDSTKNEFLEGGGAMGKLIRSKDWSKTPLGDPKTWPQPLKTMVSVMLDNPFAIYIAWGKEYTQIYNDGYRPILGTHKHPHALGASTKDSFNEIWEFVGPMFADVMEGKAVSFTDYLMTLNRNGFLEDCYFDFAYSPIRLESGEVGGILTTITETTAKKKSEDALRESKKELEFVIEASKLGTFDFNSITNKFSGNKRLETWFGFATNEQIDINQAFDLIAPYDKQRVSEAISQSLNYDSGGNYDAEYTIINGISKKEIIVHAKGKAWFNEDKVGYRLNGTLEDVTDQVLARKKVEESEQNMRTLVESAPFPIGVFVGEDMLISLANQSIMDAWGKGNDVIGKLYSDILPELENQRIYDQIRGVLHTGIPFHAKNQKVDIVKDGVLKSFYFNYSLTPLRDANGNVHSVMNTAAEVTQLNEAKYRIEESEKRFREVVKQAPLGIVILRGPEYVVEIANETYLQIVDQTEKQFIGQPLFDSLPEVKESIASIFEEIYKSGNAFYGYEFPVNLKRNGQIEQCFFNFVYHPLKENNMITSIMVVATEVTATVKAKHQIEENEEKLQLIIQGSELGVFDVNLKTNEITSSNRCYEILGFPEKRNLTYQDFMAYIHPDDIAVRNKAFEDTKADGILHYQTRLLWNDQSIHWIDVKGKVFFDAHNTPERILGTVRDITEEKTFQQQLLEREEKFRLLADSMPQQVWTADPEGNLNYFNQTVFDYSGLSLEELITNGWLEMVHPDDRAENTKQWFEAVTSGNDFLLEHRFRKHNGDYRWQLSRATPQKDKHGVIKMWVGSSTDIQEQKMFTTELENKVQLRTSELRQKNIDLERMNKELQSFVYISSHDLQEPLRKIQTFSSRIVETEYATLSETAKKHFTRMQKSAFRMQNLIQDLIAYSRTNIQEIKYDIIDLNEVIKEVQETLSEELDEHHVSFNLLNVCEVKIIPVQFKQVLHNLISNSIKFAKADHPILIEIDCETIDGNSTGIEALVHNKQYCHIRYTDNGIGFEPEYNEKIFEVFQRLHSKDEYTGTGIGLAIVKRIIDNHEGFIRASGNLNEGAIFDIYIPVHEA